MSAPMDVVVVGAHGKIARALSELLIARGDRVRGVVRNPEHAEELEAAGVTAVVVDLEDEFAENDLTHTMRGADAVVFAAGAGAGSGPERKLTVDFGGAVHSAAAAARAEVLRFVVLSSMGTDDPPDGDDVFSVYLRAKARADHHIRSSGLDYTIVRPGALTDEPPTGRVRTGRTVDPASIPRADVAAVLLAVLDDPNLVGRTFEVTSGNTRITDAVAGLADNLSTLV